MPTDEEKVRQALALWSQTDADKDADGFAALFTEDGSYISKRGVSAGRDAVRANLADRNRLNPAERRTMHLLAEPLIEVSGDTATAVSPYVGYGRIGDSPWEIMSVGRIHTKLVRAGEGWLFTEVENRSIGAPGGPATIRHAPSV